MKDKELLIVLVRGYILTLHNESVLNDVVTRVIKLRGK